MSEAVPVADGAPSLVNDTTGSGGAGAAEVLLSNVTKAVAGVIAAANATETLLSGGAGALGQANATLDGAAPPHGLLSPPDAHHQQQQQQQMPQHGHIGGQGGVAAGATGSLHHNAHHLNNPGLHAMPHHGEHPRPPLMTIIAFYMILFVLIMAQTGLFWWKKKHRRSYELTTLLGLWIFPSITCIILHFWRFFTAWCLFTGVTGYLASLCLRTPMARSTPRTVYTWFLLLYKVSVGIGFTGYFLLLMFYFMEAFGLHKFVHDVVSKIISPQAAILWIWYGLYFGIMGRDSAEVCSDMMSKRLGSGRQLGVSANKCGICNQELRDFTHLGEQEGEGYEKTVQLACKHCFHNGCIRGWTIVGKKDLCPVCNEKVDLRALYADRPWETRNLNWIQMLDAVRYMVVWNPLILLVLHGIFSFLGIADQHPPQHLHGGHIQGGGLLEGPALAHAML